MKKSTNLFADWRQGKILNQKVYLIRIYYQDRAGNFHTCLKLGRTKQKLHDRVITFLNGMRRATGFLITHYELVSILYNSNCSGIEYGLHMNLAHLSFFTDFGVCIKFDGSNEILRDTPDNCQVIQRPDCYFEKGKHLIPYNFRKIGRSAYKSTSNVV